jgi:hypothetical protein
MRPKKPVQPAKEPSSTAQKPFGGIEPPQRLPTPAPPKTGRGLVSGHFPTHPRLRYAGVMIAPLHPSKALAKATKDIPRRRPSATVNFLNLFRRNLPESTLRPHLDSCVD